MSPFSRLLDAGRLWVQLLLPEVGFAKAPAELSITLSLPALP